MRLAIVSDIHGNLPALEAVIEDIKTRAPDMVVNLGDCVSGPLWPREVCDLLMSLNWPTIRGNCDRAVGTTPREVLGASDAYAYDCLDSQHLEWLANLLKPHVIAKDVFACHGTPAADDEYLIDKIAGDVLIAPRPEEVAKKLREVAEPIILCGHSHVPRIVQTSSSTTVVNPGSVGLPAYDNEFQGKKYYAESGSPHARYAILTGRNKKFTADLIAVDYEYEMAAQKAHREHRQEYVRALRQGTMRMS